MTRTLVCVFLIDFVKCLITAVRSCLIYKVLIQLRSKIRDQRDKRDSRDLPDPAKNLGLGPGPGRKIRKSGIRDRDSKIRERDWDRDSDLRTRSRGEKIFRARHTQVMIVKTNL